MPFKMISLFPINMITDRPRGRDDLRTQREERGRGWGRGGLGWVRGRRVRTLTKGSRCVKCLPCSENALVMIFLFSPPLLCFFFVAVVFVFVFCRSSKCWNCFQSERLFLFVIRNKKLKSSGA